MRKLLVSLGAVLALTAGLLAGCGGGGAGATSSTTLSGSAVKGPVNGGTVTVSTLSGTVLGTTTTSPSGTYSLVINYSGDVVVVVEGGSYIDEATGNPTTLNQLKSIVTSSGGTQTVHLTPLTYLAYYYSGNTVAGFNTALGNLATQFGLGSTNLLSSLPDISTGTTNAYGQVLRAVSRYVANQGDGYTLDQFMVQAGATTTFAGLQGGFATAFATINNGQTLTFAFNGSGVTVGGTGAGGGSGTCGVAISGRVPSPGSDVLIPFSGNYCVTGIAAGSCVDGNSSLTSAIPLGAGAVSVNYTISASCAAGAFNINLTP
jgi:hypothetical protein